MHQLSGKYLDIDVPQKWADLIKEFDREFLNPYINYHRPCFFPETITDEKGKQRKKYPYKAMMTPYEKLKSLPESKKYLKDGVTFEIMDKSCFCNYIGLWTNSI